MLRITILGEEFYDEESKQFINIVGQVVELEHSLVSLSKWESIHEIPFLDKTERTPEETKSYIQCMMLHEEFPPEVFAKFSKENLDEINTYINRKMTATWFSEMPGGKKSSEVVTSELIYYWLTLFNIPFTVETWHLNRLLTLIRVCNLKSAKPKKMSRSEIAAQQRQLNEERKKQYNTRG